MGFNQGTVAGASSFPLPVVTPAPPLQNTLIHPCIITNTHTHTQFHYQCIHTYNNKCPHLQSIAHARTHTLRHTGGGQRRLEGVMEGRMKNKERGSAGLPGSQLLLGCCLLLAMSCNCQFILSQAFHHRTEPGWRKPPESLRNLLATSHQQRLLRCAGARDVRGVLLQTSVSL